MTETGSTEKMKNAETADVGSRIDKLRDFFSRHKMESLVAVLLVLLSFVNEVNTSAESKPKEQQHEAVTNLLNELENLKEKVESGSNQGQSTEFADARWGDVFESVYKDTVLRELVDKLQGVGLTPQEALYNNAIFDTSLENKFFQDELPLLKSSLLAMNEYIIQQRTRFEDFKNEFSENPLFKNTAISRDMEMIISGVSELSTEIGSAQENISFIEQLNEAIYHRIDDAEYHGQIMNLLNKLDGINFWIETYSNMITDINQNINVLNEQKHLLEQQVKQGMDAKTSLYLLGLIFGILGARIAMLRSLFRLRSRTNLLQVSRSNNRSLIKQHNRQQTGTKKTGETNEEYERILGKLLDKKPVDLAAPVSAKSEPRARRLNSQDEQS